MLPPYRLLLMLMLSPVVPALAQQATRADFIGTWVSPGDAPGVEYIRTLNDIMYTDVKMKDGKVEGWHCGYWELPKAVTDKNSLKDFANAYVADFSSGGRWIKAPSVDQFKRASAPPSQPVAASESIGTWVATADREYAPFITDSTGKTVRGTPVQLRDTRTLLPNGTWFQVYTTNGSGLSAAACGGWEQAGNKVSFSGNVTETLQIQGRSLVDPKDANKALFSKQ